MVDPDLEWIDFISRDGGMTKNKQKIDEASTAGNDLRQLPLRYAQITIRLNRSECEPQIAKMREATARFLVDLDATVARIKSICPEMAAQTEDVAHAEADGYLPAEYFEGLT
jgi:hypothetical protein